MGYNPSVVNRYIEKWETSKPNGIDDDHNDRNSRYNSRIGRRGSIMTRNRNTTNQLPNRNTSTFSARPNRSTLHGFNPMSKNTKRNTSMISRNYSQAFNGAG